MHVDRAYFINRNGLIVATSPDVDAPFGRRWVLLIPIAPAKANQSITVTQSAPATAIGGTSFTVAATATSGLAVAITTSGVCTGSGAGSATITMTSATGTCTVLYNQAGNADYNPAPQVTESVTARTLFGNPAGSATTDNKGVAWMKVSLGSTRAGTYADVVGASFAGDATHAGSGGQGPLSVKGKK
jgi:hypothetical protein